MKRYKARQRKGRERTRPNPHPVLWCLNCAEPTEHTFKLEQPPDPSRGRLRGLEQVFACDACGKARRFGLSESPLKEPRLSIVK